MKIKLITAILIIFGDYPYQGFMKDRARERIRHELDLYDPFVCKETLSKLDRFGKMKK